MKNGALKSGVAFGFLGVALGAFGAHGLKKILTPEMQAVFETGVRYQMMHALLLAAIGLSALSQRPRFKLAAIFFSLGVLLFSGSLYVLALSGVKAWGMITPLGGLLFLAGWAALGVEAFSRKEN